VSGHRILDRAGFMFFFINPDPEKTSFQKFNKIADMMDLSF